MKYIIKTMLIIQFLSYFLIVISFILDVLNRFASLYTIFAFLFWAIFRNLSISVFSIYTNRYPKNSLEEYKIKSFINNYEIDQNILVIQLLKQGEVYTTLNGKHNIKLDLTNYAFPENYIRAYLIRQIRFVEINNTLSLNNLFRKRFKSKKFDNLKVHLIIQNEKNEETFMNFTVVENGYFKSSFIINIINRSKYYKYYLIAGKYECKRRMRIYTRPAKINEEIYKNSRIINS